jgi:hypothetical protein
MPDADVPFRSMLLEEFTPLVGRVFTADCEPNTVEIKLVEANPLRASPMDERPPFILIFHTPQEVFLVEGIYTLRCGRWGPGRISIGPTMAPPGASTGHYYQAVFN